MVHIYKYRIHANLFFFFLQETGVGLLWNTSAERMSERKDGIWGAFSQQPTDDVNIVHRCVVEYPT